MTRLLRSCVPVLCLGLLAALPLTSQTAPPAGYPPAAAPGGGQRAPYVPKNLKVLPDNTDLKKVMAGFAGDLGVQCGFCHTPPDPVTHRPDRASDANPVKDKARYMITMTQDLNTKYLAQVPNRKFADQPVTCGTCHRGQSHPSVFVAPPRPEGPHPDGPPPTGAAAPPATH